MKVQIWQSFKIYRKSKLKLFNLVIKFLTFYAKFSALEFIQPLRIIFFSNLCIFVKA
jgi:hypothetical protein